MATSIVRATRKDFDIAGISVTGLMMPDGQYRMSDTDIAAAIQEPANSLSHIRRNKAFKALASKGSALSQAPQKIAVEGNNAKLNCSTIEFAAAYWILRARDNDRAFALSTALTTESIQRRFDRAFEQKVTEAEYDAALALRLERLQARRTWTDVIKDRMIAMGYYQDSGRVRDEYKTLTVAANKALFNQPHFKCDRDNMTQEQQQLIGDFERAAQRKAKQHPNATPHEIVEMVLQLF